MGSRWGARHAPPRGQAKEPEEGGGWADAQRRWAQPGRLTSYEKVGAVLSAGQLLRISTVALMSLFQNNHDDNDAVSAHGAWRMEGDKPPPIALFHLTEHQSDGVATLRAADDARRIYERYAPPRAAGK
jgi:hypothetical protein